MNQFVLAPQYQDLLTHIKQHYQKAQLKAAFAINREMIQFYWQLDQMIMEQQAKMAWGSKFLDQLSKGLQTEFPGTAGFSVRNLKYMRKFAQIYSEIGQQPVAQLEP